MNDSDRPWGYILTLGGLAIVAVALLVVPGMLAPKPASNAAASPEPLDPHVVVTPDGTLTFGLEDGAIVIRRTVDQVTTELGRATLPASMLPAATDEPVNGSAMFVMLCPLSNEQSQGRFVFGHLDGPVITYDGPTADGQAALDGLFLFALRPGVISDSQQIHIESSAHNSVGSSGNSFGLAASGGALQPSGCRVSG